MLIGGSFLHHLLQLPFEGAKQSLGILRAVLQRCQGLHLVTLAHDAVLQIGDVSLFTSGFFADSLRGKLVDVDYYVNIGGAAYNACRSDYLPRFWILKRSKPASPICHQR